MLLERTLLAYHSVALIVELGCFNIAPLISDPVNNLDDSFGCGIGLTDSFDFESFDFSDHVYVLYHYSTGIDGQVISNVIY